MLYSRPTIPHCCPTMYALPSWPHDSLGTTSLIGSRRWICGRLSSRHGLGYQPCDIHCLSDSRSGRLTSCVRLPRLTFSSIRYTILNGLDRLYCCTSRPLSVAIGMARILEPVIHILWLELTVEWELHEWSLADDDRGCTNADHWHYSLLWQYGIQKTQPTHIDRHIDQLIYNKYNNIQAESKAIRHIESSETESINEALDNPNQTRLQPCASYHSSSELPSLSSVSPSSCFCKGGCPGNRRKMNLQTRKPPSFKPCSIHAFSTM